MSVHRGPVAKRGSAVADAAQSNDSAPAQQDSQRTDQADGGVGASLEIARQRAEFEAGLPESIASHANNARQLVVFLRSHFTAYDDDAGPALCGRGPIIGHMLDSIESRLEAIVGLEISFVHAKGAEISGDSACKPSTSTDGGRAEITPAGRAALLQEELPLQLADDLEELPDWLVVAVNREG